MTWADKVITTLLDAGVGEFVVCAGARNLKVIDALHRAGAHITPHFEERSAGFYALGRMMETSYPVAVVTTSGTAVAELLPAVIEAHYQSRPLIVISADRPKKFRGTGAPQAIEHIGIFSHYIGGYDDLTEGETATLLDDWKPTSPWHINLCMEEGEVSNDSQAEVKLGAIDDSRLPPADVRKLSAMIEDAWRGMVVLLGGLEPEEREETWHFLKSLGAPVLADTTSGMREMLGKRALVLGDRLLSDSPPANILRIGDIPTGRFWRDLESMPETKVISITRTGLAGLARDSHIIHADIPRCLRALGEVPHVGDAADILKRSARQRGKIDELLESYPESEPGMIRTLSVLATMGGSLYLGNSLPIREWNDFAQREIPYENVRANRGANGIDGQISTWLGCTADREDAWGIFGDLTTLYDLAAPSLLGDVNQTGRILVVINNSGGRIFERLPQVQNLPSDVSQIISNEHQQNFQQWAEMWGMNYTRINGMEDFDIEPSETTTVVEIIPDARQTKSFWQALRS